MGVLPSLRATLRSDKQPPMSELSPNAKSALKAACPLLAGADIGRTRWPSYFYSRMAERQCEAVNRIVAGENFWRRRCVGDQISESCGPEGGVRPRLATADNRQLDGSPVGQGALATLETMPSEYPVST